MKPKIFISHSPEQTIRFAESFAGNLKAGDVVALEGELGSGKTTFIKGLALGLGIKNSGEVKSPTFALMHVYETRIPLYHFDLYRLETIKEIEAIGFAEFLDSRSAVTCVEWASKAGKLLPGWAIKIKLSAGAGEERRIEYPPGVL